VPPALQAFFRVRWNTLLCLCESFLPQVDIINQVLKDAKQGLLNWKTRKVPDLISDVSAGLIQDAVEALRPIEKASKMLEGEAYPTLSMVVPVIEELLEEEHKVAMRSKNSLARLLEVSVRKRFESTLAPRSVAMRAAFLDLRWRGATELPEYSKKIVLGYYFDRYVQLVCS